MGTVTVDLGAIAGKVSNLGTAATEDSTAFATAEEGEEAASAVQSVVAGSNVTVDDTDPKNPVVSASGGSGGSVNKTASSFSAYKSTTKTLALSGTAFGSSDGDPIAELDLSFTPKSATSKLLVSLFSNYVTTGANSGVRFAVFVGSATAAAIVSDPNTISGGNGQNILCGVISSPGTSAVTFTVRWAVSSGTGQLNGSSSVQQPFGGTCFTTLVVEELP